MQIPEQIEHKEGIEEFLPPMSKMDNISGAQKEESSP